MKALLVGLLLNFVLTSIILTSVDARPYSHGASLNAVLAKIAAAGMRGSEYETGELDHEEAKAARKCCDCNKFGSFFTCGFSKYDCCPWLKMDSVIELS
jgi:hypothetical protein